MFRHRDHNYFVYIVTNPSKTVLYTGVTNDLNIRMQQHRENKGNRKTFAGRYFTYKLVYFEWHTDINQAIEREKEIKRLSRQEKIDLIRETNPLMNTINVYE